MMLITEKIRRSIFTLGLLTPLVLGHLLFSFVLYEVDYPLLDYYGYLLLALFLINAFCFLVAIILQFTGLPEKLKIMNAALGLLLNIPVAFIYLIILLLYGT